MKKIIEAFGEIMLLFNLIAVFLYAYDSDKYYLVFLITSIISLMYLVYSMLIDETMISPFRKGDTYTKSDQIKVSIFFIIVFFIGSWLTIGLVSIVLLMISLVFSVNIFKLKRE